MNIQDIADFIDLVKSPAKYEKALKSLQEEQQRLQAVIETVGKASELSSMRDGLAKDKERLEKAFAKKETDFKKQQAEYQAVVDKQQKELSDKLEEAQRIKGEADAAVEKANQTVSSYISREKALRQQEEQVRQIQADAQAKQQELDEKLAKLRSVMG